MGYSTDLYHTVSSDPVCNKIKIWSFPLPVLYYDITIHPTTRKASNPICRQVGQTGSSMWPCACTKKTFFLHAVGTDTFPSTTLKCIVEIPDSLFTFITCKHKSVLTIYACVKYGLTRHALKRVNLHTHKTRFSAETKIFRRFSSEKIFGTCQLISSHHKT